MIQSKRRGFLLGLGALFAAPAIAKAENIMRIKPPALILPPPLVVPSKRTFYVDPDGDDNNSGATAAEAKRTIQAMINYVRSNVDIAGGEVTIKIAEGTHSVGGPPWAGVRI